MKNIVDYMIIQRDTDGFGRAEFAGKFANDGKTAVAVRVMNENDNLTVVPWQECEIDGDGWKIKLEIPQGGLYRVEARAVPVPFEPYNNRYDWADMIACACHVGVGEVFVLAGQSNMSGYGKDPAYDPPELGVHLFDNAGNWVLATHPLNSAVNPIYVNDDNSSGTSPGLAFGKMMKRKLGVPVGLVAAARGGSSLEWWNPAEEDPYLFRELEKKLDEVGKFTGMVWYQGCNETNEEEAYTYYEKFEQALSLWRRSFGDFPIVVCQINRHAWKGEERDRLWGLVREAQRRAGLNLTDVYVIPTMDMPTVDGIHNTSASCIVVGERAANAMLTGYYGMPGVTTPNIKKIRRLDSRNILLELDGKRTMRTMDDLACGMNIEDENGMAECSKVTAEKEGLKVTCEREFGKNAVFHAYWKREEPAFFVRDNYGLPMLACYGVNIED